MQKRPTIIWQINTTKHWGWGNKDSIKTYIEETVMGQGALKVKDGKPFYEMGCRAGWDCGPVIKDEGQSVKYMLCDGDMYNPRIRYYEKHLELVYATDYKIRQDLGM